MTFLPILVWRFCAEGPLHCPAQAVEVLQALGDQLELGQSLQIPLPVDPWCPQWCLEHDHLEWLNKTRFSWAIMNMNIHELNMIIMIIWLSMIIWWWSWYLPTSSNFWHSGRFTQLLSRRSCLQWWTACGRTRLTFASQSPACKETHDIVWKSVTRRRSMWWRGNIYIYIDIDIDIDIGLLRYISIYTCELLIYCIYI